MKRNMMGIMYIMVFIPGMVFPAVACELRWVEMMVVMVISRHQRLTWSP